MRDFFFIVELYRSKEEGKNTMIMSTPLGGVDILFLLFPASGCLVSAHLKEKYLSYLYQIWYGCLLG